MSARVAVLTTVSAGRQEHLSRQRRFLAGLPDPVPLRVEAWLDAEPPGDCDGTVVLHIPPGPGGMRVAEARNRAAEAAIRRGAEILVFLDVDCLPGPGLLPRYVEAAGDFPDEILCGAVTYLRSIERPESSTELAALTRPHPARPAPGLRQTRGATSGEYDLFWSLSFAVTAGTWDRLGGFAPEYEGYGAEDTDLGWSARRDGIGLRWVGGADAYHQWHPTSSPPREHLDDILRNGAIFARRWGTWPMTGWLEAFAAEGLVERAGSGWRRVGS